MGHINVVLRVNITTGLKGIGYGNEKSSDESSYPGTG
jgi:hypothetical protein